MNWMTGSLLAPIPTSKPDETGMGMLRIICHMKRMNQLINQEMNLIKIINRNKAVIIKNHMIHLMK